MKIGTSSAGGFGGGGGAGGKRSWEEVYPRPKGFYATHRKKLFPLWLLALMATPPIIVYVFSSHPLAIIIGLAAAVLAGVRLSIWEIELERQKKQEP